MFSDVSEDTIRKISNRYANFALVSIWTRLLVTEYREDDEYNLVTVRRPAAQRDILSCLPRRDRRLFIQEMIGNRQSAQKWLGPAPSIKDQEYDRIYDRVLNGLRAIGTTVLCNSYLEMDHTIKDEELLQNGIHFKRWFFRSCFVGCKLIAGKAYWPGVDRTLTLIKRLGGWITYYGAFSSETEKPRDIDPLPGSRPGYQDFTWFGGSLKHLRRCYLIEPSRISVHALAGMSGFSRALPPPSEEECLKESRDTLSTLSTKVDLDPWVLDAFEIAASRVSVGYPKIKCNTHCSINATASFECNTEDGGAAAWITGCVNKMLYGDVSVLFENTPILPKVGYDVFGRVVISEAVFWTLTQRRILSSQGKTPVCYEQVIPVSAGMNRKILFGNIAYRDSFLDPRVNGGKQWNLPNANPYGGYTYNRDIVDIFHEEIYTYVNETLGDIVTLWAMSDLMSYGHFIDDDGNTIKPVETTLAIFAEPGIKTWVQDKRIPAKFIGLQEPGWKTRALTKNKSSVVVLQSLIRHPVAEVLESDPRVGIGLKSSYILWDFLKLIKNTRFSGRMYSISTDLKGATNRIPIDLLRRMWKGFLHSVDFDSTPLRALRNLIIIDHEIWFKPKSMSELEIYIHECGSFQGEPPSFMGLSLYNLCVTEITAYLQIYGLQPYTHFELSAFKADGPLPSGKVAIVGDDRKEITDEEGKFPRLNSVYVMSNGAPSPGKNTVSHYHGVLAEGHTYIENGYIVHLDTIKPKLLTPSCRYHSDNRSSVIGKGSQLYVLLNWMDSTHPNKSGRSATTHNSRLLYSVIFTSTMYPKDLRLAFKLPIFLPTTVGGISFPIDFKVVSAHFESELNFLWYILHDSTIEEFFLYAMRIRSVNSNTKRALKVPDYSYIWKERIRAKIEENRLIPGKDFNPSDKSKIYTLSNILDYVKEHHPEIPVSRVTDQPQVNLSIRCVHDTYGFMPLEAMLDVFERQETFKEAFSGGIPKRSKLTFHGYVNNLNRFWRDTKENAPLSSFTRKHNFSDIDQIHWLFQKRCKAFIHIDMCGGEDFSSGPTLFVRLGRHKGVQRTRTGWDDLRLHAVSSYLANMRADWEDSQLEVIPQTAVLGDSSPPVFTGSTGPVPLKKKWSVKTFGLSRAGRLLVR